MTTGNARFKIDTNTLYDHLYLNCYFSLTRQLTLRSIEDMPNETSTTHSADPRSFLGCQGAGFAIISPQSQCRCKRHKRSRVDLSPCAEPKSLQRPCQRAGRQSQPIYGKSATGREHPAFQWLTDYSCIEERATSGETANSSPLVTNSASKPSLPHHRNIDWSRPATAITPKNLARAQGQTIDKGDQPSARRALFQNPRAAFQQTPPHAPQPKARTDNNAQPNRSEPAPQPEPSRLPAHSPDHQEFQKPLAYEKETKARAYNMQALASSSMGPRSEERGNVQTLSRTLYYFLSSMRPRRVTRMSYHGDSPSSIKNWLTKGSPNRIPPACILRMVGPTSSISFCSFAIRRTPKLPMKSIPSARAFRRAGTSSKSATPPERKTDAITSNSPKSKDCPTPIRQSSTGSSKLSIHDSCMINRCTFSAAIQPTPWSINSISTALGIQIRSNSDFNNANSPTTEKATRTFVSATTRPPISAFFTTISYKCFFLDPCQAKLHKD